METVAGKKEKKEKVEFILKNICDKKELRGIDNSLVLGLIEEKIRKNKKLLEKLSFPEPKLVKTKEFKALKKEIRAELRKIYGVFSRSLSKKKEKNREKESVLKSHQSTRERNNFIEEVYNAIFSSIKTEKDKKSFSVCDLGCGVHPLLMEKIPLKIRKYVCIDIGENELNIIKEHFKGSEKVTTKKENLLSIKKVPDCEIYLLFKVLDSLESLKRGSSDSLLEKIIKSPSSRYIIISCPTKTITGKEIKTKRA